MSQIVEGAATYESASQVGEEAFLLVGVVFVEYVSYDRSENGIAEIFEALVVDIDRGRNFLSFFAVLFAQVIAFFPFGLFAVLFVFVQGYRLVQESQLVEFDIMWTEAQDFFYLQKRLLFRHEKKPNVI